MQYVVITMVPVQIVAVVAASNFLIKVGAITASTVATLPALSRAVL
jgi:hypothetical protein